MYLSIHSIHDKYLQQTTKKLQDFTSKSCKIHHFEQKPFHWEQLVTRGDLPCCAKNGVLSLVALVALAFPRCEQRISRSWATAAEWDHVSQSSVTWFQNHKGQEEFFFHGRVFFFVLEGGRFFFLCVRIVFGCFPTRKKSDFFGVFPPEKKSAVLGKIMFLLLSAGRPVIFCW